MRREARNQLVFLSAQFLLGMAVNLIGQPSETTGAAHAVSSVLLGLEIADERSSGTDQEFTCSAVLTGPQQDAAAELGSTIWGCWSRRPARARP